MRVCVFDALFTCACVSCILGPSACGCLCVWHPLLSPLEHLLQSRASEASAPLRIRTVALRRPHRQQQQFSDHNTRDNNAQQARAVTTTTATTATTATTTTTTTVENTPSTSPAQHGKPDQAFGDCGRRHGGQNLSAVRLHQQGRFQRRLRAHHVSVLRVNHTYQLFYWSTHTQT